MRAGIGGAMVGALVCAMLGVTACNRGTPAGQASDAATGAASTGAEASSGGGGGGSYDGRAGGGYADAADRPAVPMFHGEPMWSENRRHTAKENAEYHFERAGQDLGSKTLDDFLTKVHHFGDHPPVGTLSLTRANGDRLLYDPKTNLFAVFTRQGAPRTVFKPSSGMDYWREQKTREAQGGAGGYGHRGYGGGYGGESAGDGSGAGGGGEGGG